MKRRRYTPVRRWPADAEIKICNRRPVMLVVVPSVSRLTVECRRLEDVFDTLAEQVGDSEREGQTGLILSCLDCIDRLPRHFKALGQVGLCPVALGPQDSEAVLHR